MSETASFQARLKSLDALKTTVVFFAVHTETETGALYDHNETTDVKRITIVYDGRD